MGTILIVIGAIILAAALLTVAALWYIARQDAKKPDVPKPQPVGGGTVTQTRTGASTTVNRGE
jgi:hypothetical protein